MLVFYFFATVVLLLGILSLRGGFDYLSYFRRELSLNRADYTPRATVIAPCRGLDQGLRENIEALFRQDYPAYEIIFVCDSVDDPALGVVEEVRRESSALQIPTARVVIAGRAQGSGQKVHNLIAGVLESAPETSVLVFVDTDARPKESWLRDLIAPLADKTLGAATGYRWFVPVRGGFASRLRSTWNASIASALGGRSDKNFCWGGSTAIRRETFEELRIIERWRGALSDDFALTRALQEARRPIHFVPQCLTASLEDCGFRELLEFTTRQMKITRVYAPHLWKAVLLSGLIFVPTFFGGLALIIVRARLGLSLALPTAFVLLTYILGVWKAWLRWRAVGLVLSEHAAFLRRDRLAQLLLWPIATLLFLYNSLAAAFSRRITWRGIRYELRSPTQTLVLNGTVKGDSLGERRDTEPSAEDAREA